MLARNHAKSVLVGIHLLFLTAILMAIYLFVFARHPLSRRVHLPSNDKTPSEIQWVWLIHFSGSVPRSQAVWSTWARQIDPNLTIVAFGRPTPEHLPSSVITVAYRESSAWAKTRAAFLEARRLYPSAKYFSKFDDDAYVYSKNLHRRLFSDNVLYGGYPLRSGDSRGLVFASGGAGYSLHQSAVDTLVHCPDHGLSEYEDVAMRYCLGIDPVDLVGSHPHNPWQMLRWDRDGHPEDHVRREEPDASYLVPLTYHYVLPDWMERMHDDSFIVGFVGERVKSLPKIIHQFWEGRDRRPPLLSTESCRDLHREWTYHMWDTATIQSQFPSGQLVNHAEYSKPGQPLNLLSDIARYEFLLFYGGVYIDADTRCLVSLDFLWRDMQTSNKDGFCVYESEKYASNVEGHKLVATGVLALYPFSPTSILLVKHLPKTDWSLPPWMSAGPLYATKLFKRLELPLVYLPSHLFYPYHHSDQRPSQYDVDAQLQSWGSLTDQLWGTTHSAYPSSSQITRGHQVLHSHPKSESGATSLLQQVLHEYAEFHLESLSPVNKRRPRWIVVPIDPAAGMCNRIMNLLSALLVAIATRRTLLFDWDHIPPKQWHTEQIGHSGYTQTFGSSPLAFSYREALEYLGLTHETVKQDSIDIDWGNQDFLVNSRTRDLDMVYPQSVLFIQRFDWWGPLLLANRHYANTVFKGVRSDEAFSALFRFLFPPSEPQPSKPCSFFVQVRRNWERQTASLEQFVNCAAEHSLHADASAFLLSDTNESPKGTGLIPVDTSYCRNGEPDCDRRTVQTMYQLAECRHGAVLTATSSFGACIAGLGRIPRVLRVTDTGECHLLKQSDPALDVGVLASQEPELARAMLVSDTLSIKTMNAAFVYLMYEVSLNAVNELRRSLVQLHQFFNSEHHYPIVVFVDDASHWEWLQAEVSARVHLVEISAKDGQYDIETTLWNHPYLERFDLVLLDAQISKAWSKDPFVEALRNMATSLAIHRRWIKQRSFD